MSRHRTSATLCRLLDLLRDRLGGQGAYGHGTYGQGAYGQNGGAHGWQGGPPPSWQPSAPSSAYAPHSPMTGGTAGGPPPFPGGPATGTATGSGDPSANPRTDSRWNNPSAPPSPAGSLHGLFRKPDQGKVAGVCAGMADYFGIDVGLVRVGAVFGLVFAGPLTLGAYAILALVLKPAPRAQFRTHEEEAFWRAVTAQPGQTVATLHSRLRALDQQISAMEGFIASREFDLRRQFKDLEK